MTDRGVIPVAPVMPAFTVDQHPLTTWTPKSPGFHRGVVPVADVMSAFPVEQHPVTTYQIRQLQIVFRQLWPPYGQRFPQ